MVPRGEMTVTKNMVSREWALLAAGRLVAVARGEQTYFDPSGVPTASEGCKSNALMRCCKDLGIASELWWVGTAVCGWWLGVGLTRRLRSPQGPVLHPSL